MISIENLSDISKKLLYIQNVRPLLRKEALFSDGTEDYVIPPQPGIGEEVKIRFRTAKANADSVYLCSNGKRAEMKLEKRTELFDYYQISCVPDEEKFYYYFEIINRFEHCFYINWAARMKYRKNMISVLFRDSIHRTGQKERLFIRFLPIDSIMEIRRMMFSTENIPILMITVCG